ncbi:MAG: GTP-binding protein, partial [Planctomycetota bacterium]
MAKFEPKDIRSVAIAGHGTSGKTTLLEALLAAAGAIKKPGSVDEGSTVTDFDAYEKETKHSIDIGLAYVEHGGSRTYLVDTPGYPDFIGNAISGLSAVDTALIAVDAQDGVRVNTRQVWEQAGKLGLARAIVVTRLDLEHAKWEERIEEIRETFGEACVPFTRPAGGTVGSGFAGVEAVLPTEGDPGDAASAIVERAVETDDELMMRYLDGETIGAEELGTAVHAAIRSGHIVPIFATAAERGAGVPELLEAFATLFPRADERRW